MKALWILALVMTLVTTNGFSQSGRTRDIGVTVSMWMPGEIELEDLGYTLDQGTSPMIKVFYDYYIVEKFCVGMYATMSPTNYPDLDETATMYEFGMSMKPRIPVSPQFALKPGFNIGYRIGTDLPNGVADVKGLALNMSIEGQIKLQSSWMPHVELGFLAQPVGGNDDTDVTFAPIWYFGAGVSF